MGHGDPIMGHARHKRQYAQTSHRQRKLATYKDDQGVQGRLTPPLTRSHEDPGAILRLGPELQEHRGPVLEGY